MTTELEIDSAEINRTLKLFHSAGETFEIRIPNVVSDFFTDPAIAVSAIEQLEKAKKTKAIYHTLNPVIQKHSENTTDDDILERHWLPIDFDPVRPTGISSTDNEKQLACDKAVKVKAFLSSLGFPEPITGDSGNGYHLNYRIQLPAKDNSLIEKCLSALDFLFSDVGRQKLCARTLAPALAKRAGASAGVTRMPRIWGGRRSELGPYLF